MFLTVLLNVLCCVRLVDFISLGVFLLVIQIIVHVICDYNLIQRHMKKNASVRSIKNIMVSPVHKLSQKKMSYIDPTSCRHQPLGGRNDLPNSTKANFDPRRKMFANVKLLSSDNNRMAYNDNSKLVISDNRMLNNENSSQINVMPGSPQTRGLQQSSKAYDQLKNKINSLEGRLVEIKKNFQMSFQKRSQKSKLGRDGDSFREKQKSRLVLGDKDKMIGEKSQIKEQRSQVKDVSRPKEKSKEAQKDKENQGMKRKTVQLKGQKGDSMLQEYVTTFTCQSPTTLLHCTSEASLFKVPKTLKATKQTRYYIDALLSAFANPKPTSFDQLCKNHLISSVDILGYIKNSNKKMPPVPTIRKLPPTQKPTLIFDLDQTLIHCNQHATMPCDVSLPIKFPNGAIVKAGINIRPWARQCLQDLSKDYQVMVFTASHECYANVIIDHIDPRRVITHRFFRDSCWRSQQGFYVKDLRVIDRDLKNVLLIDNAAYSYCFQLENGVPIVPFYDNKADLQLKSLVGYVRGLDKEKIRDSSAALMKLKQYNGMTDTKQLLSKLYDFQN